MEREDCGGSSRDSKSTIDSKSALRKSHKRITSPIVSLRGSVNTARTVTSSSGRLVNSSVIGSPYMFYGVRGPSCVMIRTFRRAHRSVSVLAYGIQNVPAYLGELKLK